MKHKHQCELQWQTINMGLDKNSRALLVKLFYHNNNSDAALREYRRVKEYGEVVNIILEAFSAGVITTL